jgi:hypothetical protein
VLARKKFDENDVEAGRRFVKAYVIFTHYVEKIYDSALKPAEPHGEEWASLRGTQYPVPHF